MNASENISQVMSDYNPKRYLKQLLVVRAAYESGRLDDHPKSYDTLVQILKLSVFVLISIVAFNQQNWMIFSLTVGYVGLIFVDFIIRSNKQDLYDEAIITAHMNAGFSRAEATEFIYDIDWDDIQYGEDRLEYHKKKAENAKN